MPLVLTPSSHYSSPIVSIQLQDYLVAYAGQVHSEPYWTTPTGDDTPYKKRQLLAKSILAGNKQWFISFANLLGSMVNQELDNFAQNQGQPNLYRWLLDNRALELEYNFGNFGGLNQVGTQSGNSIFDKLAGIDQLDMQ